MIQASELQAKDVVNIGDGRRLGTIGDLEIDLESGTIQAIIIPAPTRFFGFLAAGEEVIVPWHQIVRIGEDVVLVDMRLSNETSYLSSKHSGSSGGF